MAPFFSNKPELNMLQHGVVTHLTQNNKGIDSTLMWRLYSTFFQLQNKINLHGRFMKQTPLLGATFSLNVCKKIFFFSFLSVSTYHHAKRNFINIFFMMKVCLDMCEIGKDEGKICLKLKTVNWKTHKVGTGWTNEGKWGLVNKHRKK